MMLIDRYILGRFLTNFALLFVLMFLFAIAVDIMVSLDRFVEAAHERDGEDLAVLPLLWSIGGLMVDFQAPRFFQFYAYLHGLVAIGAMGFTLAQMYRNREILAILSAGLSMQRIAMPFIVACFGLSIAQLINQELFLPRVAPLLLRDHGDIGQRSVDEFPIALTPDGQGHLLQSPLFDPRTGVMSSPTVLERDERGRTRRRITAENARWFDRDANDRGTDGWALTGGQELVLREAGAPGSVDGAARLSRPLDFFATDLSPRVLIVRRHNQFAAMLSLRQIKQMLETPGVASRPALLRYRYSRFSAVLVNVLVMWLALPTFLIRQPASLLMRAVLCAGIAIPAMLGAAIFMVMELPGIPPAVGVFLPVIVLIPVVLGQWTYVKT